MKRRKTNKDNLSEDYCFICKDGGHLRVCDNKNCLKSYHPQCLGKDPSFLESDDRWTCGCHTCFICQKSSAFQCYCCPNSVCRTCINVAEFVQVKKKTKGFCSECLSMTILIEEKKEVYSDGQRVDFEDRETCEFLFKDYWKIIKEREGLKLIDLQAANALLKSGSHCKSGSDSAEEDEMSDYNDLECENVSFPLLKGLKGKPNKTKMLKSRYGSRKRTFIGWGSEELITFLNNIGKDTKEPLTHLDACEAIKNYIRAKNLYHPDNKKKKIVICDDNLHRLFRKKKLKLNKIFSLLEHHLAEYNHSDDEISLSSEDEDILSGRRKKQRTNSGFDLQRTSNHCIGPPKGVYASIVAENINAIYLRKSLVVDLLKTPMAFEEKVSRCFVRVKNDLKENIKHNKAYQLGQVSGVKKSPHAYKIGEVLTDFILCVSNIAKDVQISMLSDDDIEEEECEDLRQLVKEGLLKKPTVVEMEEKIKMVHEDIINHWIDRELKKLQRLIDRANEKGWRKELFDYIDKREDLSSSEGRKKLLDMIPQVISDALEVDAGVSAPQVSDEDSKGYEVVRVEKNAGEIYRGYRGSKKIEVSKDGFHVACNEPDSNQNEAEGLKGAEITTKAASLASKGNVDMANGNFSIEHQGAKSAAKVGPLHPQNEGVYSDLIQQNNGGFTSSDAFRHLDIGKTPPSKKEVVQSITAPIIDSKRNEENASYNKTSEIQVIDLLDDDDQVWYYLDPSGKKQGPFDMNRLMHWKKEGYFHKDFKVWRTGQSKQDAISLTDAIRLCQ